MEATMRWSEQNFSPQDGVPTIKNHSVTHFRGYLYCFGGYDSRIHHSTLLVYSIEEKRWIRPQQLGGDDQPPFLSDSGSILVTGTPPQGRNGHSATLATNADDDDIGRIIIIGGWLGRGPLAASDMHVLEISHSGKQLRWFEPPVMGTPPGPCNMHSADYVAATHEVYVFRGGDGREYLNDLHALNTRTFTWRKVETTGAIPQQRASHSSSINEETGELLVFGGWNGSERLNDIHILDTATSTWTCPHVSGVLPHPRAGMTLTALRGRLYMFGGIGTSSRCFQDLQILDRSELAWLDVTQHEHEPSNHPATEDRESRYGVVTASPNHPNVEDTIPTIVIHGRGPSQRTGHTATAVNQRIYVFGGSYAPDYSNYLIPGTQQPNRFTQTFKQMKTVCPGAIAGYATCIIQAEASEAGVSKGACSKEFAELKQCFQNVRKLR